MFSSIDQSIVRTEKMNKIFSYIKSNFFIKILIVICLILTILFGVMVFLSEENTSNDIENLKSQGYLSDDIGIEFHQFNLSRLSSGTLFNDQKKLLASKDLVNKPYLLNFWATWCGPCRAEFDELELLWKEDDLVIVGVNVAEEINDVEKFVKAVSSTFEIVLDQDNALSSKYNVRGIPVTFLIYNDKVYYKWTGPISPERVRNQVVLLKQSGVIQ